MFPRGQAGIRAASLLLSAALCARAGVAVNGKVLDDNGVAVAGAQVQLDAVPSGPAKQVLTDKTGLFALELEAPGEYRVRATREGFFELKGILTVFQEGENQLVVTLNRLQEFADSIDVAYSPPAIESDQPAERKQLNTLQVLSVPYAAPQDVRNALPLFNGVVADANYRPHVNGAASDQTSYTLNGFNVSDPVTGRLETRLNIETVQSLELETSRFAADKGRASAGALEIRTKMGDDHWRFGGTNFLPGLSTENGIHVSKWTPRLEFSGPLARGRAWFHNGFDAYYDVDTVSELPAGANRARSVTANNLSRFQVNLTPGNILTTSFLVNYMDAWHSGLSFVDPVETTTNEHGSLYMSAVRDQIYLAGGTLLDVGFADMRGEFRAVPQGSAIYQVTPFGSRGNYFVNRNRHMYRQQWNAGVLLPERRLLGSHQIRFGVDFQREAFHQWVDRHDYEVLRVEDSVSRHVTFAGNGFHRKGNFEGAHYIVDHWTPREGLSLEASLRADWDQVVRDLVWSPRISVAWAPKALRDTKFALGYGIFHDSLTLGTLSRGQDQSSWSTFYSPGGDMVRGPVEIAFRVNEHALKVPRFETTSVSVERKLPFDLYGRAAWTDRRGGNGLAFVNGQADAAGSSGGEVFSLANARRDHYEALELSLRRTFSRFEWQAGYTRSSARVSDAVDYSLENPIFGPQAPGPLPWDTPHRFLAWGWAPLPERLLPGFLRFATRETNVATLVEYRTGFPFTAVNDEGVMAGPPNGMRLPSYFNLNLHFERKVRLLHYLWAWRVGFNNLTNNGNPNKVNSNIDSPLYLTYGRGQVRAFSVRLRLLGKK